VVELGKKHRFTPGAVATPGTSPSPSSSASAGTKDN
jgi:hypothetical protein